MIKLYLMNYMIRYASNYLGICNKLPDAILALYIYIYIYIHTHTHTKCMLYVVLDSVG